jgi:hypothetical protein
MPDARTTRVVRLDADNSGQSAFATVTIPMLQKELAPPACPKIGIKATPSPERHDVANTSPRPDSDRIGVTLMFMAWVKRKAVLLARSFPS